MGVVFKAHDTRLERLVALKFLPDEYADDPALRQRFLREARAASALNHPNICTVYEIGEDETRIFLAMEFLDGETLKDLVRRGPVPYRQLLDIAEDVAAGLEAAHQAGVIHRDVKLANVFVTKSGRAKILDFGLAKKTEQESKADSESPGLDDELHLTSGLAALGTAAYMSPEQALGRPLDRRTDLFSFGIVLYEMATGRAPFHGDTTGVLFLSILQETPAAPRDLKPDLPDGLQNIIQHCLEKDREQRYSSAAQIHADLEQLRMAASGQISSSHDLQATVGPAPTRIESVSDSRLVEEGRTDSERPRKRFAWSWPATGSTAVVIALLIAGFAYLPSRKAQSFTSQDKVVVADFTNTTDDAIFDGTLRQALATDLGQSPFVYVVPDRAISAALKQMSKPANERLSREVARELCLRTNSRAYVAGSISQEGQRYQIELEARNCESNDSIASAKAQASDRNGVIAAVGTAGQHLRRELGESPSIQQHERPLIEATTSSLEALQAFSEGQAVRQRQGDQAGLSYLKKAVELDPNFAQAHVVLGTIYQNLAQAGLANEAFTNAYQLRNRVDQRERYLIESTYFEAVTGEAAKARKIAEDWVHDFPGDSIPRLRLARQYENLGQYDKAAEQFREAIRLDPNSPAPYSGLMMAYMQLNKMDEAKATYEAAKAHQIGSEYLSRARFYIAFIERDQPTMQALLDAGKGKPGYEDRLGVEEALATAYYGRLAEAEKMFANVITVANAMNARESAAEHNMGLAFIEAEVGNAERARVDLETALAISSNRSVKERASLVLARIGDDGRAERLANELNSEYALGTIMEGYTLPSIRAMIEIDRKNPSKAIELLNAALPYELAMQSFANVQPAYVRGLAYLQAGDGPKAAAEFRKVIANPGVVISSIIGAIAHLQLARAEKMSGNNEQARTAYQDFLALWKNADPNLPVLKQAKGEYAALEN